MRRIPLIPTLLVLAAVAVMLRLGFWQLERMHQKQAMLADYAAARVDTAEVAWPRSAVEVDARLYRRTRIECVQVTGHSGIAGSSAAGESGVAQTAQCFTPGGASVLVVLGWTREPVAGLDWNGGDVRGVIAPGPRLVADPPLDGLAANRIPDPAELPNNHLSYAVQWFLFAATALVIYALALRKRWRG